MVFDRSEIVMKNRLAVGVVDPKKIIKAFRASFPVLNHQKLLIIKSSLKAIIKLWEEI